MTHTTSQAGTALRRTTRLACAAATLAATLAASMGTAQAANVTFYGSAADLQAAIAGPTVTQDFSSYAVGANLSGVEVLPGVNMTTNLSSLAVFNSASFGKIAFATPRNLPEAEYTINFTGAHKAFGFEIVAFDPATPGPGFLSLYFADGDITYLGIPILPGATEQTRLFQGFVSDQAIMKVVWSEGPEIGNSCCEETGLANLMVAAPVPEAGTLWMMLSGLAGAGWVVRRRRTAHS
jgi:PEP-CTERM motif